MSIQFNDSTNYRGLVQLIAKRLGQNRTYFTEDSDRLKEITAEINQSLDDYTELAIKSSGKFQWDDSNHTTYPILTGNLVDGQRDYSFTADSDGNLVLEIYRVFVKNSSSSPYYEIFPVDVQSDRENLISPIVDGLNVEGKPYSYDKTANGLFLDPIPDANVTNGLKVYVNREGSYFTSADTTKKAGIPGIHHDYLVVKSAYKYAVGNLISAKDDLARELIEWEGSIRLGVTGKIEEYFGRRSRDERDVLRGTEIIYE